MSPLAQVMLVAAGTFVLRGSLVAVLGRVTTPPRVQQALELVAPAALAGLVAQTLLVDDGAFRGLGSWHVAAAVAALVGWRTKSVGLTLVAGMCTLWALTLMS